MTADGKMTIWMRLRNAREVVAGLRQTAAATTLLGDSTERLALKMDRAGRRTFLMNQALFTLRRYSYFVTLGLTAATFAVAKWGFEYDSQVQTARIAFAKFGLTHHQVLGEIRELYRIAAISPFLFTDITNNARRFMAFGFSVKTTNALLHNLTDALTAMGFTTGASLNRATLALVHMSNLGRVTGQLVTQLTRDNIPIVQALEKELGVLPSQLHNISTLGIPASTAIAALNKYISETPRFHGAALIFATKTWRGIVTTTRDYMAQFLGTVEEPLFKKMQKTARRFLGWITSEQVNKLATRGDIAGVIGTFSPAAARVWKLLAMDLRAVWSILVNGVIPAFRTIISYIGPPIYVMLYLLSNAFAFLGRHTLLAKIFFALLAAEVGVLILRYMILLPLQTALILKHIVWNTIQRIGIALGLIRIVTIDTETGSIVAQTAATERQIIVSTRFGGLIKRLITSTILWTTVTRLWTVATVGSIRGANGQFLAMTRLEKVVRRGRLLFLALRRAVVGYAVALWEAVSAQVAAILTNPITWVIVAIAVLGVLYWKWKRFHDAVNNTVRFLWHNPLASLFFPVIGPLIVMIKLLNTAYHLIRAISHFFGGIFGGGGGRNSLALGGGPKYVGRVGLTPHYVGAAGLGSASAVRPIGTSATKISGAADGKIEININHKTDLNVDGKKMAEAVSKHRLDGQARR